MEPSGSEPWWLDPVTNGVNQFLARLGIVKPVRPLVVGPSSGPREPYPLRMEGKVIHGYGRGSKELGIPTANLPIDDTQTPWISGVASGVYFGWASLRIPDPPAEPPANFTPEASSAPNHCQQSQTDFSIYPMVMSIGYNPFYDNTVRSAEVHVLHDFAGREFYGCDMRLLILGFIRAERKYSSKQELIDDIHTDCEVARRSLAREAWSLRETGEGSLDGSWLVREGS